ncbi:amino acid transporter [Aspergillus avenaceus]|uniref:Amino acid transporter n=1 Tax=Aspergillus avenaceus TaxID=36643 RepID=A0A5N6U3U9_ASPAV|nr:amino acid transporter [Aspergillus avenaceus]
MKKQIPSYLDPEAITHTQSQVGEGFISKPIQDDAVFGEIREGDTNYRDVSWMGTTALMIKTQIGLGVLSMPKVFDILGIVPGIIILLTIAGMTTWLNWIVGKFKLHHPNVYGIDDVGKMLFGRVGFELFGAAYTLYWIFSDGSALLSISISFNALSDHAACTAVFVAVAAIIAFIFSSIQTLARMSWLAWLGAVCIIIAVFIVTVAVGIQGHAPLTAGVIPEPDVKLFGSPTFVEAMTAVSTICLTYAAFYPSPDYLPNSVTAIYIVVGTVIYYYCGSHVASPALGSAGILIKRISYGFALPGLSVSATLLLHLPDKHVFIRILRGTKHLTAPTRTHWIVWLGSTFSVISVAYIVASSIPVFSDLVSLVGALLATPLCFQPMGCMWLYDNWEPGKRQKSLKWCLGVGWCIFMILAGFFLTIGGTYSSIVSITTSYHKSGGSSAWSCANNDH